MINLIGQNFGRLIVIKQIDISKNGHSRWLCECNCGSKKIILSDSLKSGRTKSCGCLSREKTKQRFIKHGHKGSKTYESWQHMNQRCNNPNNQNYSYYGDRGITVCKQWRKFENFLKDMGKRPSNKHSLDRINNNDGYYKENCQWATKQQQNQNKCNNIYETYRKKTQLLTEWAKEYNIPYHTLWDRLYKLHWSIEKALITSIKKGNCNGTNRSCNTY